MYGPALAVSLPVPALFVPGPNNSITLSAEKSFAFLQNEILIKKKTQLLAVPHGMRDLSSPVRDLTCAPCIGRVES